MTASSAPSFAVALGVRLPHSCGGFDVILGIATMTLKISAIEQGLDRTRAELAHWWGVAACFEAGTAERQVVEKKIEMATIRLKADTNLVAYLRRRIKLYRLFDLPPPPDVCE